MKEKLEQIKEFVGKLSSKTKKLIIAGAALLLIAAVAVRRLVWDELLSDESSDVICSVATAPNV